MSTRLLLAVLIAASAATTAAGSQVPRFFSRTAAIDTLNAYEEGRYDEAADYLERVARWVADACSYGGDSAYGRVFQDFARRYSEHAAQWILEVPDAERLPRRRIAAIVALEIAGVTPLVWDNRTCVSWAHTRAPLEWACGLLRTAGPPTMFERLWHHAAFALIERARDTALMSGGEPRDQRERDHAQHAIERFPDEPRFKLASLLARPELQVIGVSAAIPIASIVPPSPSRPAVDRRRLDETLDALDALAKMHDVVRQEAKMRAGVLRFLLGELDQSLADLDAAAFGANAFARYIAGMITALIHEKRHQPQRAIEALREAIAAVPDTRTARLALAARLFVSGAVAEATSLADAAVGDFVAPDPWRQYGGVDYLLWPNHLQALRASIR
jgi:tetratricopeptide (TPR) repeat protein